MDVGAGSRTRRIAHISTSTRGVAPRRRRPRRTRGLFLGTPLVGGYWQKLVVMMFRSAFARVRWSDSGAARCRARTADRGELAVYGRSARSCSPGRSSFWATGGRSASRRTCAGPRSSRRTSLARPSYERGASARGLARDHELVVATRSLVLLFVPVLLERLRERVEDVTAVILLPVRADDRPVGRPLPALLLDHRLRRVESPTSDVFWLLGAIPPRHLQLSPHYLRSTAVSVVP